MISIQYRKKQKETFSEIYAVSNVFLRQFALEVTQMVSKLDLQSLQMYCAEKRHYQRCFGSAKI